MKFTETARIYSELFECDYIVGKTDDGRFVYVWTDREEVDGEFPDYLLQDPECTNGALVGTEKFIIDDIESCVGGFRYHGTPAQQEEAKMVVETLLGGLE